ncbi:MAG: hypothetical protein AABX34_04790 [Nanoarchaeota archaeon]
MKIMITALGILITLAGILPMLSNFLPSFIPTTSPGYQFLIIAIGILGLLYASFNSMLFGTEKFVTMALAALTILGGILPFLQNFISAAIPTSGILYSGMIILIGIAGIIYGFMALG